MGVNSFVSFVVTCKVWSVLHMSPKREERVTEIYLTRAKGSKRELRKADVSKREFDREDVFANDKY